MIDAVERQPTLMERVHAAVRTLRAAGVSVHLPDGETRTLRCTPPTGRLKGQRTPTRSQSASSA